MAWNPWVQIVTNKHAGVAGGLYGMAAPGTVAWATEGEAAEAAFTDRLWKVLSGSVAPSDLQQAGPKNRDVKYFVTTAQPDLIMGKKEGHNFIATKSTKGQCWLLFFWNNQGLPPNVVIPTVESLKKSLADAGY